MKIIIREWLKDKKACVMMMVFFVTSMISIFINARIIMFISNAFADSANLYKHLVFIAGVCVVQIILAIICRAMRSMGVKHCFTYLNNAFCDKILEADYELFTKFSVSGVETARNFIGNIANTAPYMMQMLLSFYNIGVVISCMYQIGGNIIVPVIIIYVIGGITFKFIFDAFKKYDKFATEKKKERNQELENSINGFAEVRACNTARMHSRKVHNCNQDIMDSFKKRCKLSCALDVAIEGVDALGLIAVMIFTMAQISEGNLTQAQAMSLVMYVFRIVDPLFTILSFMDDISQDLALSGEYDKIISYTNQYADKGTINLSSFEDEIRIDDVSFSYDNTANVINNVTIVAKKGQKIGICGASGGGKSTLFKLISRFYKPNKGAITIDGCDIWDITNDSYRKCIGVVFQDNIIFPGSIRQNILYGVNALDCEMVEACKKACIYDFISSLPDKFETEVGPRGLKLSGGQKQRIALARMFLKNPDIVLLDEATSALDNESESLIQDAIDGLEGKTIITIAHRLSTIRNSDKIYVLDQKGVVESGTHDELMAMKGAYYSMQK